MTIAARVIARHPDETHPDLPFGKRPTLAELKARVAGVSAQIKARAYTTEKSGRVPAENISALREINYFDIVKPRAFGGYQHDFDVLVDLNIDLAKACATIKPPARRPSASFDRFIGAVSSIGGDVWGLAI